MDLHFYFETFVSMSVESYKIRNTRESTQVPVTTRMARCAAKRVRLIFVVAGKKWKLLKFNKIGIVFIFKKVSKKAVSCNNRTIY